MSEYRVTLPANFKQERRVRAGIEILRGKEGYVGPLTSEQLEAINADETLTVEKMEGNKSAPQSGNKAAPSKTLLKKAESLGLTVTEEMTSDDVKKLVEQAEESKPSKELLAKAKKLKIEVSENATKDEVAKLVEDAEKAKQSAPQSGNK